MLPVTSGNFSAIWNEPVEVEYLLFLNPGPGKEVIRRTGGCFGSWRGDHPIREQEMARREALNPEGMKREKNR